ncbi:NAD-dependent epimerase/dehydratase family protein [Sphingobacterium sp. lm-10]|uniref:NAD-dependent epimerase/dehydratase family protein n=1 Tax=Sphingobacterium sp. lm-10 TaxID=2944904 RepID=UPI0020226922|nr:NAD-dependent epimerase/dehydratase family protein [Sphingobacterium sp. lm-10]MCL7988634.1 NAD-dependent epimerase/dehydratase family protein [Sphingobacterium sp. lm-10]
MITITGSKGFVGRNLFNYFKDLNIDAKCVSLREKGWEQELDNNSATIIHLAGKAHDTNNTSTEDEYFSINRDLTIKVFQKFLASDIRDFFYFSSVKAVADSVEGTLVEDTAANPLTPYGKSKLEAEQFLLQAELPEGKRLFIIRSCMIHGPGNKGNLNLLYKVVNKGLPWPLAAFPNHRSFISIDNLCYLIDQMIERPELPSGVYNFADDDTLSTNEIVAIISEIRRKKPKFWRISASLITRVSKIGDALSLPLNSERLKKLTESYIVSNHKIKNTLGIDKLPLTAREGMAKTIRSFVGKQE